MAFIPKQNKNEPEEQRMDAKDQRTPGAPRFSGAGFAPSSAPNKSMAGGSPSMAGNPNSPMAGGGSFGRFVSLGEYMGQNQNQAQAMAGKVAGNTQQAGQQAQGQIRGLENSFNRGLTSADKSIYGQNARSAPGTSLENANPQGYEAASKAAQTASQQASGLGNAGGVQNSVKDAYSAQGQSSGEGLWDAAQAQQAGGGRFAQLAARYGNLSQALNDANARSGAAYESLQKRNTQWDVDDEARRREEESIRRINETTQAAMNAPAQGAVARNAKAEAYRQEDAGQSTGGSRDSGGRTKGMTREEWANRHGMTLEQWIANGENPPF